MAPALTVAFAAALPPLSAVLAPALSPVAVAQVPGPESFAKEPETPFELWAAVDYLVRTEQIKAALPYLDKFVASRPDDATLMAIRDRFGAGSILRLGDHPETAKYAGPLVEQLTVASHRFATQPERIQRYIGGLTRTPEEQTFALTRLKQAGAYAIPFLVKELQRGDLSPADRSALEANLGRLDRTAVPALIAVLDSPDPKLAAEAAAALGEIGDRRAVPFLLFPAVRPDAPMPLRTAARGAVERLTGRSPEEQPKSPARTLLDASWKFHRNQVEFPGDSAVVWLWDEGVGAPSPQPMTRSLAEDTFAERLARWAIALDPADHEAKVALLSTELESAVDRNGVDTLAAKDPKALADAVAAGPGLLADVLGTAIKDGKDGLGAVAATALGQAIKVGDLSGINGRPHPLAEALAAPGRQTQLAAARAIVALAPDRPFPGSSMLVPTLARFAANLPLPRAVVIDSNPDRGSQLSGFLRALGYETAVELTGPLGFQTAAEAADVELICMGYDLARDPWGLADTLANLRADARTSGLPLYIYGPADLDLERASIPVDYPGVRFLVQPVEASQLERQLGGRPSAFSDAQRSAYAREATTLLAKLAALPGGPFAHDLAEVEPSLAQTLHHPETQADAVSVLEQTPSPAAQQALADLMLDPSRSADIRVRAAGRLVESIRRFGRLVAADQEVRLEDALKLETSPEMRDSLSAVVDVLRPHGSSPATSSPPPTTAPPASPAPRPPEPGSEAEPELEERPEPGAPLETAPDV
jgi:hypothetical protein